MKRSPLRPVSSARKLQNAQRRSSMESAFGPRSKWRCAVQDNDAMMMEMGSCFGPVHGHEIVKRSQGGSITDMSNVVLLCNVHNDWIEEHRQIAHDLGLVRSNWEER